MNKRVQNILNILGVTPSHLRYGLYELQVSSKTYIDVMELDEVGYTKDFLHFKLERLKLENMKYIEDLQKKVRELE